MGEQGLAQQGAMGGQQINPEMVMQVKQLLQQGVSPDELIQQGVPQEVVEMAIQQLQQEQAGQEQGPVTQAGQGLAGSNVPMM